MPAGRLYEPFVKPGTVGSDGEPFPYSISEARLGRVGPTVTSTGQILWSVRELLTSPERRKAAAAMKNLQPDPISVLAHPAIAGLMQALPHPGAAWTAEDRDVWMDALRCVFDLVYKP